VPELFPLPMLKTSTETSIQNETVSENKLPAHAEPGRPADITRRQMGVGLLAMAAGGLGIMQKAQAFTPAAHGDFNSASRILDRYGVAVTGEETAGSNDLLDIEIAPVPKTDYGQTIGPRGSLGEIVPCVKTRATADADGDVTLFEATHYHEVSPGFIVPCVRTSIIGHSTALYEQKEAVEGVAVTRLKVEAEMEDDGALGAVTVWIDPSLVGAVVSVGGNNYVVQKDGLLGAP
jgi:hypothetical protein